MTTYSKGIQNQNKTLKKLLSKARNTEFGKHHNFQHILKSDNPETQYKTNVDIYDYNKLNSEWWYRYNTSNSNITWPGKIKYFAKSSGTSGAPSKYIPVTEDQLKSIRKSALHLYLNIFYREPKLLYNFKNWLTIGGTSSLQFDKPYYVGDLSGIVLKTAPTWSKYFNGKSRAVSSKPNWKDRMETITEDANSWDPNLLIGNPAWVKMTLENIIQKKNINSLKEIWPNLEIYVGGGVDFEPYRKSFAEFCGNNIKFYDTYLASEGFIAYQKKVSDKGMTLLTNNGIYYEFIPYNCSNFFDCDFSKQNIKSLNLSEVKSNENYALVISTSGGAGAM